MSITNHKEVLPDLFYFDVEQANSGDKKYSVYLNIPQKTEEISFNIIVVIVNII